MLPFVLFVLGVTFHLGADVSRPDITIPVSKFERETFSVGELCVHFITLCISLVAGIN